MPLEAFQANQALPTKVADGSNKLGRGDGYGDALSLPLGSGWHNHAVEGTYWRTTNPTPGTAIAQAVTSGFVTTTPLLVVRNTDSAGGKSLILDYIKLLMTVIPASATAWDMAIRTDTANRYTSGGTQLTPVNSNTGSATSSIGDVRFGAVTAAAESAARQLARDRIFNAIPVVNTPILIKFGEPEAAMPQTINGAAAIKLSVTTGPVVLGPGNNHSFLLYFWYPSNATTPASFEVEMGWIER